MTSVTTGSPVSRLASARYLSPSSSSPWKEYGDVRGLKAPPRKTRAPAALTFAATSSTCPRDSTEHVSHLRVRRARFQYDNHGRASLKTKAAGAARGLESSAPRATGPPAGLCAS